MDFEEFKTDFEITLQFSGIQVRVNTRANAQQLPKFCLIIIQESLNYDNAICEVYQNDISPNAHI